MDLHPNGTPGPSAIITAMAEADWPEVRAVYAEGISTGHATFESEPPSTWSAFSTGKHPGHRLTARAADGRLLGWAAVSPVSTRPVYAGVAEHSIYIAAAARGQGIGRTLLDALIASTEAGGIWTLQSSIFGENTASLALHHAAGFRTVGTRRRIARMSYGPLAGTWRDTILIERRSPTAGT
jgi:L-amino acid N-acyltransferase YncA